MHLATPPETKDARSFTVVFDMGDEVVQGLADFANEHDIDGARVTGIGAFEEAELAFFEWEWKEYEAIPVEEQVEVASLQGNISRRRGGDPKVHVHVVLGRRDGTTFAGHLKSGTVRPTLEVFVVETPEPLTRERDEETGLALLTS